MNPLIAPWSIRRKSSCHTFCASPMSPIASASPTIARTIMSLRPYLSPRLPQKGTEMMERKKGPAAMSPLHCCACWRSLTPRSRTKSGRNGKHALMAIMAMNCAAHSMRRFFFQSGKADVSFIRW